MAKQKPQPLNLLRRAAKFKKLKDEGLSERKIRKRHRVSQTTVHFGLKLAGLKGLLRKAVEEGRIPADSAVRLHTADPKVRQELLRKLRRGDSLSNVDIRRGTNRVSVPRNSLPKGIAGEVSPDEVVLTLRILCGRGKKAELRRYPARLADDWEGVVQAVTEAWKNLGPRPRRRKSR